MMKGMGPPQPLSRSGLRERRLNSGKVGVEARRKPQSGEGKLPEEEELPHRRTGSSGLENRKSQIGEQEDPGRRTEVTDR